MLSFVNVGTKRMYRKADSTMNPPDLKVIHDADKMEFYIRLKDGKETKAVITYSQICPGFIDLEHTYVPAKFRGHGVAKALAQAVFDHFSQERVNFRPTCTYLQKFYKENPLPLYQKYVKWK